MAKVGRPTKYKEEYCEQLIKHMSEGLSFKAFGYEIGVDEETLYTWLDKHPKFLGSRNIGRQAQQAFYEKVGRSAILGKVDGFNSTAFVWMTKNMLGWRDRHEVIERQSTQEDLADGLAQLPRLLKLYSKDSQSKSG